MCFVRGVKPFMFEFVSIERAKYVLNGASSTPHDAMTLLAVQSGVLSMANTMCSLPT